MNPNLRKLSPILFGFALFCFVLPFLSISTKGFLGDSHKLGTLNGLELVIGPELRNQKQNPEPLAILALVATLAGLAFSLFKEKILSVEKNFLIASTIAGAGGCLLLLLLKMQIDGEASRVMGMAGVSYEAGFWLAFLALLAAGGVNGFQLVSPASNAASAS